MCAMLEGTGNSNFSHLFKNKEDTKKKGGERLLGKARVMADVIAEL